MILKMKLIMDKFKDKKYALIKTTRPKFVVTCICDGWLWKFYDCVPPKF
jgi:hypothetical protein